MELNFSKNVKALRKQQSMTQEQLAEAMGVTVGAIYKWEQGLSTPDIRILMELASFFHVSVDALVGYEIPESDKQRVLQELKQIKERKEYRQNWNRVDGWIRRYPNDFDIVYHSGVLYHLAGIETEQQAYLSRGIELMTRACQLIAQNTDPKISKTYIYRDMAIAHLLMGHSQEGIRILQEQNPCGVNNDLIGQELATIPERREEAWPYLSLSLLQVTSNLLRSVIGYVNLFFAQEDYRSAIEIMQWMIAYLDGLREESRPSYLDKDQVFLLALCGAVYGTIEQREEAKACLRRARDMARNFDAEPDYSSRNIRYCKEIEPRVAYDNIGQTAMSSIEQVLREGISTEEEQILVLWEEICHEA